jgi:2-keto-4-pentenoate hydratase/2-oxohepta-3-ene-1,7-dioic acid hydratase in catechol pathway
MRLISYRDGKERHIGVMRDDRQFVPVSEQHADVPRTLKALLAAGPTAVDNVRKLAASEATLRRIDDIVLDPVIPDPTVLWCVGLNYRAHMEETGRSPTEKPTLFLRLPLSQVGHLQPMIKPKVSEQFDYEGELAIVIGKGGRHIAEASAFDHVAGYSCYNEGSVRDWQRHTTQFGPGKTFHGTGAFGPWLVTADEFGDPDTHELVTRLNGRELQRTRLDLMLFKIPELIGYISAVHPLQAGDVIVTGTPAGVGSRRVPPIYMQPGDRVTVEISGIGTLENPIVAEA